MKDALSKIPSKVSDLIESHAKELEDAWANTGEGTLAISFPVKIGIKNAKQTCEVGISFILEKCQDSTIFEWNDSQPHLFKVAK
jgi:hypothetical protein